MRSEPAKAKFVSLDQPGGRQEAFLGEYTAIMNWRTSFSGLMKERAMAKIIPQNSSTEDTTTIENHYILWLALDTSLHFAIMATTKMKVHCGP